MDIKKLFRDSYDSLSGNWGKAIVVTLIYGSIFSVIGFILGILSLFLQRIFDLNPLQGELLTNLISAPVQLILVPPFLVGFIIFFLNISRNSEPEISNLFLGFKKKWGKFILAAILLSFLTGVGFILFIIPGIIASLMFSQVFFILAEDDDIGVVEAFQKSVSMMKGNKTSLFLLNLIMFGIGILGLFTCCIGFIFIIPYQYVVLAKFYDEVSKK
jgi:uncharacterized membrane protein